jgi:ribose-phosphate pyrophosphokinase
MKLVSGTSNLPLAQSIAKLLKVPVVDTEISFFANKEKRVWIKDSVRGENVVLVQSFSNPDDQPIVEFLLMADALERMGARHVNLVMPWMGYSLQDKVFRDGESIAAKVMANLISNSYIKRAFLLDLHNSSIPGFFSIPTHHLRALELFSDYLKKEYKISDVVVASPDFGGLKRARMLADALGTELVNIDKQRDLRTGKISITQFSGGDVTGKTVIIFDDVIVSGGTVVEASSLLKEAGAKSIVFVATHGLLVPGAVEKLTASTVDRVVITNSIRYPGPSLPSKFVVLDTAPLFAEGLKPWMPASA